MFHEEIKRSVLLAVLLLMLQQASAQFNSRFWKISGNGLKKPSYLYGTMHVSDSSVFNFTPGVMPALKSSKQFAMELNPREMFQPSLLGKLMMQDGSSLKQLFAPDTYHCLDSVFQKQTHFTLAYFDFMPPLFVWMMVQEGDLFGHENDKEGYPPMDLYLAQEARKAKRKVVGVEKVEEQLDALNSITYQQQADYVAASMKDTSGSQQTENMVRYYIAGNLDSLQQLVNDPSMPPALHRAMFEDRNRVMAQRIGTMVQEKTSFVAIGAGHLPGDGGVIVLLRKQGYTVEPVQ